MYGMMVLVGATGAGKTALLDALFGPGGPLGGGAEVVSADSMQAYRGMDIGTAKPDAEFRRRLPHHLLDVRDPDRQFTAGDFVRLAEEATESIQARGRLPVVAGGTGYYVRNLLFGLPSAPAADAATRAAVAADLARLGPLALRAELAKGDPASADRIHANDLYRLTRAVEILRATGRPLADFLPERHAAGGAAPGGHGLFVHYRRHREELAARIAARVDAMFAAGLPDEVGRLRASGYGRESPGMKAIGYAEFFELEAEGLTGPKLLAAVRARIVTDSLKYAKRQETFFRGLAKSLEAAETDRRFGVRVVDAGDSAADAVRVASMLRDAPIGEDEKAPDA